MNPVSLPGPRDEATSDRIGTGRGGCRLVGWAVAFASLAFGWPGLLAPARAQVPGPESFAQEPRTPAELWGAADYLIRTGQTAKAVPYLDRFVKSNPDDATLIDLRDRYGAGSFLRLADDPATRKYAEPLVEKLAEAQRRFATQPDRIARYVAALTGTPEERDHAVARLREAGPYAVPSLVQALDRPGIAPEERALLVDGMGRLDRSAVPALVATLDSPDARIAADAATALGRIGDARAVPFLTYPAAAVDSPAPLREAARAAIGRLTGRFFAVQPHAPSQVLTEAAWSFHRHQADFPGDPVLVWSWDKDHKVPAPRQVRRSEAEELFGKRLASEALKLQPLDRGAQVALASLSLEKAIERVGFTNFPAGDQTAFSAAKAAGPAVLAEVLRTAVADGKTELAAAAAAALGQITDRSALAVSGRPHPLVEALLSPGARLQFAAAKALVDLAPNQPFAGSSHVVPTLARFAIAQRPPRAVVIDGNAARGSNVAGQLKALGYETVLELEGDQGFLAAAETADVELVLVSHDLFRGSWNLIDTLTNLTTDARTAKLPVYVYGPRNLEVTRASLPTSFPGVKFLVQPLDPVTLERLLGGRPARLSDAERARYAREATTLLARVATQPESPMAADLDAAEPALAAALNTPETSLAAATALGDVPAATAQRSLADAVLDPARSIELRRTAADRLAHSIRRFGPLVAADQEVRLADDSRSDREADARLRASLGAVVRNLRAVAPKPWRGAPPAATSPAPAVAPATPVRP
jgi:hypothetical protein